MAGIFFKAPIIQGLKISDTYGEDCDTVFEFGHGVSAQIEKTTAIRCGTVFKLHGSPISLSEAQVSTLRELVKTHRDDDAEVQRAAMRSAGLPSALVKSLEGIKTGAEIVKIVLDMLS